MKIGKRAGAKKYEQLRIKQATANKMLYKSTHIEKSHGKRQAVLKMKAQFYHSRGLKNPSMLSFKSLSTTDLKAYEKLLDSIINNSYINPEKYKKMIDKQREQFEQSDANGLMSFEQWINFFDEDIINMLIELGVDPSELRRLFGEYSASGMTYQQFINMCGLFIKEYQNGNYTISDFFVYAYEFMDKWG